MAKGNVGKRAATALEADARFIGKRFGRLVVQAYAGVKVYPGGARQSQYSCLCDCGHTKVVTGNYLQTGTTRSCCCLYDENLHRIGKLSTASFYSEGHTAIHDKYCKYRCNAKRRQRPFELTVEQAKQLFLGDCYYCGAVPEPLNGIDRLINCLGYLPLNCVSCCWECNQRKGANDAHVFLAWVDRIQANQRSRDGYETIYSHSQAD